jgi:hypothetical protein
MAQQKDNEIGSLSGNPDTDNLARLGHKQQLEVDTLPFYYFEEKLLTDHA